MKRIILFFGLGLFFTCYHGLSNAANLKKNPIVVIDTSEGQIEMELFADKSPISVKNFLSYVKNKAYDGTIFHRVISNFMIQGGGFTEKMVQKKTLSPIKNEATNGLSNNIGTVAMARTNIVDSATSQFFINVGNNSFLNHRGKDQGSFGYAVFGKIIKGMPVVNKIKMVKTKTMGAFRDVPVNPVIIKSIVLQ